MPRIDSLDASADQMYFLDGGFSTRGVLGFRIVGEERHGVPEKRNVNRRTEIQYSLKK